VNEADAVVAVFAGSEAIKFVKQYDEFGLKDTIPLVGTSLLTDDLILNQQGDSALGIITASHYSSAIDSPANATFVAAYKEKFKRPPNLYSEGAYVAAKVMHLAIEKLNGNLSDKAKLNQTLASISFEAPRGKFRFDNRNSPVNDVYVLKVQRKDGVLINQPIERVPDISQFYTWDPTTFMKMPPYRDISETWVK
jgi:branched-chain amino acid transport system substrate-binding protein